MQFAMHGMITLYSNILSDIRTAAQAGYDGIELHTEKLWRYLNSGCTAEGIAEALKKQNLQVSAIDIIGNVEAPDREGKKKLQQQARVLSILASQIGAECIQLNAFTALDGLTLEENLHITARNIKELVQIGAEHGIRFQYEGAAWTPIHSVSACLELVDRVGEDNFGLVLDFWHLWAGRSTTPEEVAKIDKNLIFGIHCSGGIRPQLLPDAAVDWKDEREYRGHFPLPVPDRFPFVRPEAVTTENADLLPVQDWVHAVCATGYDGWVSGEFLNDSLWELDSFECICIMRKQLQDLFN